MNTIIIRLTRQELADIIRALKNARDKLAMPEDAAQWQRWQELIDRFELGAVADADADD